jgi:hypothetical protein
MAMDLGTLAVQVGLDSNDLKKLAKAEQELTSSLDSFTKSATKVGFDKRRIRELEQAGDHLRVSMQRGAEASLAIQREIEKLKVDHEAQMSRSLNEAAKHRLSAAHNAAVAEAELRLDAVEEGIQKEKSALDGRIRTYQKGMEAANEHLKADMGEAGLDFGSTLIDQLTGSPDLKGLASSMGELIGKGAGKAGTAMKGKGAAMGGGKGAAVAQLGKAALMLSAAVAPLALIAGLLFKIDEQQKDFNSTVLEGASAIDMQATSVTGLERNLGDLRGAAVAVSQATRENTKDILTAMRAANEAGLQYSEMGKFVGGAGTEMEKYQKFAKTAVVQARMLGVDINTISEQMATWSEDLGGDLDSMQEHFTNIQKAAMQSGFGTKRLFTAVSQATSGLAIYNTRIDDTIGLMGTLSKSLGKSGATEFVKALQKGFAEEGYQDRFKRLMIAGKGDMAKIMETEARSTAQAFSTKFTDSLGRLKDQLSARGMGPSDFGGVNIEALGDPNAVTGEIAKMASMSESQLRALLTQAEQADPEMAQQLQTMIRLSKGTHGSISEQAKALDAMGVGGRLATQITGGLGGKAISEMSALELAAFESYAGISGEALVELRRVDASLRGEFERIKAIEAETKKTGRVTEDQVKELIALGAIMEKDEEGNVLGPKMDEQGNYLDAQGQKLDDVSQHIMDNSARLESAVHIPLTQQEAISQGIARNTISMQSVLENQVVALLEQLTFINQGIWDATLGLDEKTKELKGQVVEAAERDVAATQEALGSLESERAAAAKAVSTTQAGTDEAKAAKEELARIDEAIRGEKALLAVQEESLKGARARSGEGLGGMETAHLYASTAGDIGTDMFGVWSEFTGDMFLKGMGKAGVFTEEEVQEGIAGSHAMIEGMFTPEQVLMGATGAGKAGEMKLQGLSREEMIAEALAEGYGEPAAEQLALDAAATKEAHKDAKRLEDDVEDLPADIAKALTEEELKQKLGALGVEGDRAMDKAVKAIQEGKMTTGATGLSEEQLTRFKGGLIGGGGAGGAGETVSPYGEGFDEYGNPLQSEADFIWRAGKGPVGIDSADTLLGGKPGGPLDKAGAGSGTVNHVTLNINGGDPQELYRQLKQWGLV